MILCKPVQADLVNGIIQFLKSKNTATIKYTVKHATDHYLSTYLCTVLLPLSLL